MRLLVAEDDTALRSLLVRGLTEAGYVVESYARGDDAEAALRTTTFDGAVLDWVLPARSGVDICAAERARGSGLPILVLTARDGVGDRIAGLDSGADDYLTKPFDVDELLARIRAMLRRPVLGSAPLLRMSDLAVDPGRREAWVADAPLTLTPREYALLERLATDAGRLVTRHALARSVMADETKALGSNSLDVHIMRLRRKLRTARAQCAITTVRGAGFRLEPGA
jgi:two-component system, OmpR family, response regulator